LVPRHHRGRHLDGDARPLRALLLPVRAWRDYQEEIGLRHTPVKKNQTDHADTLPLVPLRHLPAFIPIVIISTRRFFVEAGVQGEELQRLQDAWTKAVHLNVTLWSRPVAKEGLW